MSKKTKTMIIVGVVAVGLLLAAAYLVNYFSNTYQKTGILKIQTEYPEAKITIDNEPFQPTPEEKSGMFYLSGEFPVGNHVIEASDQTGYTFLSEVITIKRDETTKMTIATEDSNIQQNLLEGE